MKARDLIEALTIMAKYNEDGLDSTSFLQPEHDLVYLVGEDVSDEDTKRLEEIGFFHDDGEGWSAYVSA